jgi:DNA polymerase-3 subunit epsilon
MIKEVMLAIDTETTGLDVPNARIVEIAMQVGWDGPPTAWRLNPGTTIPPEATAVHGITNADVELEPRFAEVAPELKALIETATVLIGYNTTFDQEIINNEFQRAGFAKVRWPATVICAKRLWDILEPKPPRDLSAAHLHFTSREMTGAHGAAADVAATVDVLRHQMAKHGLEGRPWAELDPVLNRRWGPSQHVAWLEDGSDLVFTFGKNDGKSVHSVDDGFLRWLQGKDFPPHVKALAQELLDVRMRRPDTSQARVMINEWARRYVR